MANPNFLVERLSIKPDERAALSEIQLSDRRYVSGLKPLERPVSITLCNAGFEASFLASYEDMRAMRDWLTKAMVAIEAQDERAA